ncbi:MAG: hypothetical protein JZD41_01715 [Thermoproteus sp.]|nr:hypothetical protein [Thermoproteus sp.]
MFIVKCISCGFELYHGEEPKTVEAVAKMWGGYCPKCMSPIERRPIKIAVRLARRV